MRLIDADRLNEVLNINFGYTGGADVLRQLIDIQPTVQAVPIPANATNGDVLKAFFHSINRDYDVKHKMGQILFTHEWWNMPYEGSDKE